LLILQLARRESTARAAIAGMAATPRDSLPWARGAAEEGRAVNERNRAMQARSSRDLQHRGPAWKKGEQGLRAIRLQARDRKRQDRKEAFQGTDSRDKRN
jgi:hypothetical protein